MKIMCLQFLEVFPGFIAHTHLLLSERHIDVRSSPKKTPKTFDVEKKQKSQ